MLVTPINSNVNNKIQNNNSTAFGTRFILDEKTFLKAWDSSDFLAKQLHMEPNRGVIAFIQENLLKLKDDLSAYNINSKNHIGKSGEIKIKNLCFKTEMENCVIASSDGVKCSFSQKIISLIPKAELHMSEKLYLTIQLEDGTKVVLHNLDKFEKSFAKDRSSLMSKKIQETFDERKNVLKEHEQQKTSPETIKQKNLKKRHADFLQSHLSIQTKRKTG